MRIHPHQLLIQIRMFQHQHLRIPRHRHKQRIDPRPNRRHEYLADLQPDQERKRHDNRREHAAVLVVCGFREFEVQVREERGEVADEEGAHGQDGTGQAVVDERVDAAVFHHLPRVLRGGDVRLAVERDMGEGVAVDERDGPVEEADEAAEHAEHDAADEVALRGFVLLSDAAGLAEHVDDGDDQGAEGDGPEAVGHGAAEGAGGGAPGHSAGFAAAEVPGAVDAGDGDVDGVFDPFGDPVAGKGDEDEETDDGRAGAAATAGWVGAGAATAVGRFEGNVDCY